MYKSMPHVKTRCLGQTAEERVEEQRKLKSRRKLAVKGLLPIKKFFDHVRFFKSFFKISLHCLQSKVFLPVVLK